MNNDFHALADELAADITSGRLAPGTRLPPQRAFAYQRGIAPSTAGRVYGELVRRGLVSGEVGRGSYVRAAPWPVGPALAEPAAAPVDMETNYPIVPEQPGLLAPVLAMLAARPDVLANALAATSVRGTAASRQAVMAWSGLPTAPLFAAHGRAGLAACFSALVPVGARVGFEAQTYPVARAIAQRLGVVLVPLAMDGEGVVPDAIEAAHKAGPLRAIYLQPTLHNPLGVSMPVSRRAEIARLLTRLNGPVVIEDRVYAFLDDQAPPPLASFAPEHVVVVDSLSKRIAPGLTLGMVFAPDHLAEPIAKALASGAWGVSGFALEACTRWLGDGTVAKLEAAKRADARARQALATKAFEGLSLRASPAAYHLLLDLPAPWRADEFAQAAGALGIAITPASAFTVTPGAAPNAVRLALAPPSLAVLASSLKTLAQLAGKHQAVLRNDGPKAAWPHLSCPKMPT